MKSIMEQFLKNPGLQHISADILQCLDKKSLLMNCRLVNHTWKNLVDQPIFSLKKLKTENVPEDVIKSWKMLAQKIDDEKVGEKLALVLFKIRGGDRIQPLEVVVDLANAEKYQDLINFILEHVDPNSRLEGDDNLQAMVNNQKFIKCSAPNVGVLGLAAFYGITDVVLNGILPSRREMRKLISLAALNGNLDTIKALTKKSGVSLDNPNEPINSVSNTSVTNIFAR